MKQVTFTFLEVLESHGGKEVFFYFQRCVHINSFMNMSKQTQVQMHIYTI